jgi:iron complex outermembrane receptor protein
MSIRTISASRALLLAGIATSAAMPVQAAAQGQEQPAGDVNAAAEQAEAEISETGDIVVTARRRAESLQDVPIAVTAFSGEQLEQEGAIDITDIGDTAPNVTLEASRGTNSTLTAFIRGIGQQDPVAGFEQGVGIYLDDVYLNRPQGAVLDIYDVERIEVLRGPQGTLYGRNTIGGAIKYVTRRLPNRPELRARGTVGTYGQMDGVLTASYPVADMFRIGASVARLHRDGFGTNFTTGDDNYNKDVIAGRISAEIGNDDSALLRISADYTKDTSNTRGGHRLITSLQTGQEPLDGVFNSRGALLDPKQKVTSKGVAAHGQVEVADGLRLKSITSFRKDNSATPIDFDALAQVDVDVPAVYKNKQFSQEVQLEVDKGPLSGVVGAYYLNADAYTAFDVRLYTSLPLVLPGLTALTQGDVGTKTWAVFGDFSYEISPQFAVSVGARYTVDRRHAEVLRESYILGGSPEFGSAPPFDTDAFDPVRIATTSDFEGKRKDTALTPRVSVSFKPNDNHHLYASFSKGFKGGGFDPRGQSASAPDLDGNGTVTPEERYEYMDFDPEKVTSYELGWKASLLDKRVFTSLALFHADYKNLQIPGSIGCVVAGVPSFCGATTNAARARIQGIEFEGDARLFGNPGGARMNFGWSLGYLDSKFKKYIGAGGIDFADDRKIQNTPKWTGSGTLRYASPLYDGDLTLSSTLSYRSKSQQFEVPTPLLDQKGFALLDASAVYELPGGHWTVGLHGKNLTNKKYITAGYNFLAQNANTGEFLTNPVTGNYIPTLGTEGVLTAYYGNPRQIMFTVGYKM